MQNDPFGDLIPQRQSAPQQPAPTPIGGRRVIGGPPPSERRADEDQAMQRIQMDRQAAQEAERLRLAQAAEARASQQAQQGGVEQGKAASFLRRAINAEQNFRGLGQVQPRSLPGEMLKNAAPNVSNIVSGADRQQADQAEREFIAAILRYDSGAAIPPEEFVTQGQIYFPRPGDTPQVLRQKAEARRVAIEGLQAASGPAGQGIPLPDFTAMSPRDTQQREPDAADRAPLGVRFGGDGGPDDPFDRNRYLQERFGIDPGKETRLVGLFNANRGNPNVTADMVVGWYRDSGVVGGDNELPPRAELERVAEELRAGRNAPATGIDVTAAEKAYVGGLDTIIQRAGFNPEDQSATLANSARQGAAFEGFDEITGVVNALAEGLQGNNPIEGYRTGRDVTRRMIERGDAANPVTGLVGRVAGGIPTGILGAAGRVNSVASAARVGAAEGALTGFNAGEGAQNSLLGAAVGAPAGAAIGAGFQAGGNALLGAFRRGEQAVDPNAVQEVVDAGARRGVTVRRPDVDPNIRQQRASVQQTEQGRSAIAAADSNDIGEIETALIRDLGGREGTQRTEAATSIQEGVKAARDKLRRDAQVEYRAASAQAGNITAQPANAIAAIDQQIGELAANGRNLNSKEIAYLEGLKEDLAGGLSIDGLRAQRTGLRKKLENAGVYSSDFERRVGLVLDDAGNDIEAALQPFPEALARYKKADGLWAQQADFGKKVGDQLLGRDGNLSPGQAADRLMMWAKKDPARLNRLLSEADDATKEEVRALVASQIGRQSNGNFSLSAFLTQTAGGRGGSLSPAAVRSLFGEDGAKAIADLRILSQAKVDAASATNRSQTGGIVQSAKSGLRRLILGGIGFNAATEPMTGALTSGAAVIGGEVIDRLGRERALRLLLNPDFTAWLRRLPETSNPQAINKSFTSLRSTAARSPVMLGDVQAFERALVEAVNDNGARIAAEPQGTDQVGRGE